MVSTEPFDLAESKSGNKLFHIGDFTLNVQDINTFQEIY
jgi:hypothetical protein